MEGPSGDGGMGAPMGGAPSEPVGQRVYVGNLSWDTRWQGLKDHMREAGDVIHAQVFTEASGRSAGCGVVEFGTTADAENAIRHMNDTELDGRKIFVRPDREEGRQRGRDMGGGGGRYGGGEGGYDRGGGGRGRDRGRKIVVWNLPYHIKWQDLKDIFREYGSVIRADVPQLPDGKSKGMGTVLFETEADAQNAIHEMNGREIEGRVVDCRLDRYA